MNNALFFDENTARRIDQLEAALQTLTDTLQQLQNTLQNVQIVVKPSEPLPPVQAPGGVHV